MGYARPDGTVGIRDHVVVMPTVARANGVASAVCRKLGGIVFYATLKFMQETRPLIGDT